MVVEIDRIDFFNLPAQLYYAPPVTWSEEKKKTNAESKIFSGEWLGARKVDGCFYMFIKDMNGNLYLRPRNKNTKGEFVNKINWVPHLQALFNEIDNGTVFLGELYLPRDEQAKTTTSIMNCLEMKAVARQKKEEDRLHYYIFDVLAENGVSYLDKPAWERFDMLNGFCRAYGEHYWEWARYYDGKELWNMLQNLLADGYEGMVITYKDAKYEPGKRSNKVSLKIKKELQDTIDCVIIGANPPTKQSGTKEIETWPYWFDTLTNRKIQVNSEENRYTKENGEKTIYESYVEGAPVMPVTKNWFYGWAGSWKLGAYRNGTLVHIGNLSGLTDEMKENWKDYLYSVCEVSAMEIMDNEQGGKGLRHPKLISIRTDIDKEDCTWEKIFQ